VSGGEAVLSLTQSWLSVACLSIYAWLENCVS